MQINTGDYAAFYTLKPFWAGARLEPGDSDQFDEIAFLYQHTNYSLAIQKDGLILLSVKTLEERFLSADNAENRNKVWQVYFDHLNCIQVLLDSILLTDLEIAHLKIGALSHGNVARVTFGRVATRHTCRPLLSYPPMNWSDLKEIDENSNPLAEPGFQWRKAFPRSVFDALDGIFSGIAEDHSLVKILSLLAKSVSEYKNTNYSLSLVLSWIIIENLLQVLWESWLLSKQSDTNGEKRIPQKRKEILDPGDAFTSNVISNVLELSNEIDKDLFTKIDKTRKLRNKIVHALKDCERTNCAAAFEAIEALLCIAHNVDITISKTQVFTTPT